MPREGEICGRTPSQNMQLQIAAKLAVISCHLANTNEERLRVFAKLFWSLYQLFFVNSVCRFRAIYYCMLTIVSGCVFCVFLCGPSACRPFTNSISRHKMSHTGRQ